MAAKDLLCSGVMRQVALAGSFRVDTAGILAAGLTATCTANPMACVSYLRSRPGGLPATASLIVGDLKTLCQSSCLATRACFGPVLSEFLTGFPTEAAAVAASAAVAPPDETSGGGVAALLVLPPGDLLAAGDDITYTLRTNASDVPNARMVGSRWARESFDAWVVAPSTSWKSYWFFTNVQRAVDMALMSLKTQRSPQASALLRLGGVSDVHLSTAVKQYPHMAYATNLGASFAALFFGLVFVFAFLTTVVLILKSLVMEKELRIREGMLMSGLGGRTYWLSWFVTHYSTLTVVATLMAVVGIYPFKNSSGFIMWLFYMTWFASLIFFCYALAAVFSTSKIAAVAGSLLYILTWAPAVAVTSGDGAHGSLMWTLVCIFPASGIYQWGLAVAILENAEQGVRWSSLFTNLIDSGAGSGTFSAGGVLLMTALSAASSASWAWYLDKAAPREFGTRLPWWFPISPGFWRNGHCGADSTSDATVPATSLSEDEEADATLIAGALETVAPERAGTASVVLRNLSKWFPGVVASDERVVAVDKLSVSFYANEVTALLGHNGAGKTTTLSMLCGLIPPSSGAACIGGLDISTHMVEVRRRLGVCPQHDVLWPTLSCTEHLALYAAFRGMPRAAIAGEATRVLAEVGLADKAAALAGTLSGGQRRKLSLAIAFVGGPSVVYLDEPTTGMDPYSRRFAWNYIRSQTQGRTIILTTHFLEEADLLSSRIAIMTRGRLACCGSPLFLKSRLGLGHHLSLLLAPGDDGVAAAHAVTALLARFAPGSVCETHVGSEMSFLLPSSAAPSFPELLRELDARPADLGIASYSVTCSTLEEVFLSIAEHSTAVDEGVGAARLTADGLREAATQRKRAAAELRRKTAAAALTEKGAVTDAPLVTGWMLVVHQFAALLRKRALNAKRDRLAWATQYVVPLLFVVLGLALSHISASARDYPPALLGTSFLANKPLYATAAPNSGNGSAFFDVFGAPGITLLRAADSIWNCSAAPVSANAASAMAAALGLSAASTPAYCEPAVTNCGALGCTPAGLATASTLDAELLATSERHKNCRQASRASCAAVFLERSAPASRRFEFTLAASPSAFHALPASQSAANSAIYSSLLGRKARLSVISHPLPDPPGGRAAGQNMILNLLVSLCVVLALGSLSASSAVFLVAERRGHSKHLQMVSGVHRATFWAATAAWDAVNYMLPLIAFVVAFAIARVPAYTEDGALSVIFAALLLFGASAMPLAYLLHFAFANEMNALAAQMGIYFFFGIAQIIAGTVLRGLAALGKARGAWAVLQKLFRWLPHYNVGAVLFNLTQNAAMPRDARASPASIARPELSCMAAEAAVYMALTFAIEFDAAGELLRMLLRLVAVLRKRFSPRSWERAPSAAPAECADDDADVATERLRIEAAHGDAGDILTLRGLKKTYWRGGKTAVHPLTFGVHEGEIFALLGVNGAGKTSTFRMLTGECAPTSGDALIRGRAGSAAGTTAYNIVSELSSVRQRLGLCPQDDGLAGRLTAREHLNFYAAIRGVPPAAAAPLADALLQRMGLGRWADRQAGTYSGGNRRKLSCAIALCGEPPCVFLDEPSSGMDAESRRAMWAVLADSAVGRAMVLTTHSMDEAEALCTRVGIMVAGRLRCLGNIAHLKAAHGDGHTLELRTSTAAAGCVAAFLAQALPSAVLTEEHAGRLTYAVPNGDLPLADVFEALERTRRDFGVSDYSLVQCSLEQIFVKFASGAVDAATSSSDRPLPLAPAQALSSVAVPPSPQPAVRCPSCAALLRWAAGASVMRCGACDALVGLPAPAW